jgi:foldase protein PrsA
MKILPFKQIRRAKEAPPSRITNETVAEHRERILTGGRRFKYPMQYARHRLVLNTIVVVFITVIILIAIGWWQLYNVQNTNTFFYRITRIVPVPVASVDGVTVRYSDYLMYLNSSTHYLTQSEQLDINSTDGKRQLAYIKRKSMDNVIADAYAQKLANQLNIRISDERVDKIIDADRNTVNGRISEETYDTSALNILGWSPSEYRQDIKSKLTKQDVSYAIDDSAIAVKNRALTILKKDKTVDFSIVAKQLGGTGEKKVLTGVSGFVPLANRDGGLSEAAAKLKKGEISSAIKSTSGTGYFIVRLLDRNETQISYTYLHIPLTEFNTRLEALKANNKIHEYISIPEQ